MNPLFEAIEKHTTIDDLNASWEAYAEWWIEIAGYNKPDQVYQLTPIHVAAMIAYAGKIGGISTFQLNAFNEIVERARAGLNEQFGPSAISQKLHGAFKRSPFA